METMETTLIYGGGLLLALILLIMFWKRVVRALLLLGGLALVSALVWTLLQQATATRQVATVATIAATGSAAGNVGAMILVAVLVVGAPLAYGLVRRRFTVANALMSPAPMDVQEPGRALALLVQLEILRALRDVRAPQPAALVPLLETGEDHARADDTNDMPLWW